MAKGKFVVTSSSYERERVRERDERKLKEKRVILLYSIIYVKKMGKREKMYRKLLEVY